jgi:4-amino-4-deoxy-L-arabinose transferase-like glycosyltransferase
MQLKLPVVIVSGLLLSFIPAFVFTPVTDAGDAGVYINYALKLAGDVNSQSYITRSPLYPLILAGLIKTAGLEALPGIVIVVQFFLNFLSSVLIFEIFKKIMSLRSAVISAFIFYFNLSTIYYGYMILTETLSVFLFLLSVYILTLWIHNKNNLLTIYLGVLISLLILARFNTLPLIFTFLFLIMVIPLIIKDKFHFLKSFRHLIQFLLPVALILNAYCYLNYRNHQFYGLFPNGGSPVITRNAVLATIDGDEKITEENQKVFELFLEGRRNYNSRKPVEKKGSLHGAAGSNIIDRLYSGYQIYLDAFPELCDLYDLDPLSPEPYLSEKLTPFYKEIISQNRADLWKMRFLSLANSFRSSSGIIIPGRESVNLNSLPGFIIVSYKLLMIICAVVLFLFSAIYLAKKIIDHQVVDTYLLSLILFFLSFYLINFIFGTAGDANRFKYPSEPLMIGLIVYLVEQSYDRIREKIRILF